MQQRDINLQRRVAKQPQELKLGCYFPGHQVQDYDLQRSDILMIGPAFGHYEDVLILQRFDRRKLIRHFDRHTSLPFKPGV